MFDIKQYEKAETVKDAVRLLTENPQAKIISGGTDVLIRLREGHDGYSSLVDIHDMEELKGISYTDTGDIEIGSAVTFTEIVDSEIINDVLPVLALASATIGGPQVRNVATIGGNLCNGAVSADSLASLCVLDALLITESKDGEREIPVIDFYLGPGKVVLEATEVLKSIRISLDNYAGYGTHYYKYAMRNAMDIATIGCAAAVKLDGGKIEKLKISFTVAAPKPVRAETAEKFAVGLEPTDENIKKIAEQVMNDVTPRDSWRASKDFRLHIIETLAERVIKHAAEDAGGES